MRDNWRAARLRSMTPADCRIGCFITRGLTRYTLADERRWMFNSGTVKPGKMMGGVLFYGQFVLGSHRRVLLLAKNLESLC